jgi:hypothetical protein
MTRQQRDTAGHGECDADENCHERCGRGHVHVGAQKPDEHEQSDQEQAEAADQFAHASVSSSHDAAADA